MEQVQNTQKSTSSDRRGKDRRTKQITFDGNDRRVGQRRSGTDRRKVTRS